MPLKTSPQKLSDSVRAGYAQHVVPSYKRSATAPVLVKGKGARVWDADGKEYLDFGSGIAVNCLGHAHPRLAAVMKKQGEELVHVSNLFFHPKQAELAEALVQRTGPGKIFFCNSGAEANEAMIKAVRKAGAKEGRYEVITTINSFHGRTLGMIAASGQERLREGFGPVLPGFVYVPYNDLAAVERAIGVKTVAVMIEGIQGEGGILPAQADYLLGLQKLTKEKGIYLLMDSVQCGHYRTGRFQSYQRILEEAGVKTAFLPDAVSMAKSLGGGFPIGAVWFGSRLAEVLTPGTHATTYGGGALACAVALEILNIIEEEKLEKNIEERGEELKKGLGKLSGKGWVGEVRGFGGMVGVTVKGRGHGEVAEALTGKGLLVVPAGSDVLRFLAPYSVTKEEVQEALKKVEETL
ncbi:MAG: aminotransferase class III-fold pyridoxal phosphate-dependent enzyme [Verrucomicrobia bacterium]|nr:aminotransferase class III-fold pyridoxal phosphate-dependent enzyme [Verrucomicrobiota bacterium]